MFVVVVRNETTGEWNASWSESILAKTEGSQILDVYESFWVGTVGVLHIKHCTKLLGNRLWFI